MKRLLSTFLISLFFVGFVNATEWNISSDAFKSLGSIVQDTTVEGLTINASADKAVVVDENAKTLGDISFTHRLKLGGAGTYIDSVASDRVISFKVVGDTKITVAAMSSTGSENRLLNIVSANGDTLAQFPAIGDSLTSAEYLYEGDSTTIYLFSAGSGINIYSLKAEAIEEPVVGPIVGVSKDANCLFDPAAVNPDLLPEGMSIVEIKGKKMLQVIVNGWNSTLNVPEFIFEPGMTAFAEFKYKVGQTEYAADKINACVQIMDTINKMTVSWSSDLQTTTTGLTQSNPSGEFVKVKANAAKTSKLVHQVQFFGQQTASWGPVVGDTLWVGKVRAYKVDEQCIFDPATYDTDDLPEGMSIVTIGNEKFLQAVLNGWSSSLPVFPKNITKESTHFTCKAKYAVGTSGFELAKINTFLKLANADFTTEIGATGVASTPEMTRQRVSIAKEAIVGNLQIAGQETTGWNAVVGDTLWVGKVMTVTVEPNVVFDPAQYDSNDLPTGMSIVDIDGKKYLKAIVAGWGSSIPVFPIATPATAKYFACDVKYEVVNSGFELAKINTFIKLATAGFADEIGAAGAASSDVFKKYTCNIAKAGTIANFQFTGQETTGWNAVTGDIMYIGKVTLAVAAPITFIVDDSNLKTSTGFGLKGSWLKSTGEYDKSWDGGNELAKFYDDGTHGDATAGDNKWTIKLDMIVDNGVNSWEWGVNDAKGKWLYGNFKFTVADTKAQTLTHENTVSAKNMSASTIKVYPNPTSNMLNVMGEVNSVEIFNITGAKVLISNSNRINVSSLSKGTYIAKVKGVNGETSMAKFSKE
jgi:hypothetical protein